MTRDELIDLPLDERVKARLAANEDPLQRQVREFLEDLARASEVEGQRDKNRGEK